MKRVEITGNMFVNVKRGTKMRIYKKISEGIKLIKELDNLKNNQHNTKCENCPKCHRWTNPVTCVIQSIIDKKHENLIQNKKKEILNLLDIEFGCTDYGDSYCCDTESILNLLNNLRETNEINTRTIRIK